MIVVISSHIGPGRVGIVVLRIGVAGIDTSGCRLQMIIIAAGIDKKRIVKDRPGPAADRPFISNVNGIQVVISRIDGPAGLDDSFDRFRSRVAADAPRDDRVQNIGINRRSDPDIALGDSVLINGKCPAGDAVDAAFERVIIITDLVQVDIAIAI